jgi:predicted phage terminase large subunit-like protein
MKWMVGLVGPHFVENKASGKSIIPALRQAGVPAKEVKVPNLDKVARSRLVSVHAQNGKVFIHKAIRDRLLNDGRQGLMLFPKGSHNDVNDAFTQALNRHFSGRRGAKLIIGN